MLESVVTLAPPIPFLVEGIEGIFSLGYYLNPLPIVNSPLQ